MNYIVGNQYITNDKLSKIIKKIINLLIEEQIRYGMCDFVLDQTKEKIYEMMNDECLKSFD